MCRVFIRLSTQVLFNSDTALIGYCYLQQLQTLELSCALYTVNNSCSYQVRRNSDCIDQALLITAAAMS